MSVSKMSNDTDLEVVSETKTRQKCPKCNGEMLKKVKTRMNKYTHKKCLDCGFGYIIGR